MIIRYINAQQVANLLPKRGNWTHKGDYGKILLLCGSRGYTGAAALAAMGALRTGAGLVYLGVPDCIYDIEAVKLTEPVVFPVPDDGACYSADAVSDVNALLRGKDAVLLGCGSGKSQGVHAVLETVLTDFTGAVVLDADGINILHRHKDIVRERMAPTILTPHDGEFIRVGGKLTGDRVADAGRLAKELGIIVLLKGHETVVTDGDIAYINQTGNPGMAVGGSGDVLAGIITGLLGQGVPALEAAACGAWLHGSAGDICAAEIGQYGMLPSDMIEVLPRLLK